jgi:hypothetical protein
LGTDQSVAAAGQSLDVRAFADSGGKGVRGRGRAPHLASPSGRVLARCNHLIVAAGYTNIRSKPALARPLEQRLQTSHFPVVTLRLRGLQLTEESQKMLMQRDLLRPRLVSVVELVAHGEKVTPFGVRSCIRSRRRRERMQDLTLGRESGRRGLDRGDLLDLLDKGRDYARVELRARAALEFRQRRV